jgi:hypothetical protein
MIKSLAMAGAVLLSLVIGATLLFARTQLRALDLEAPAYFQHGRRMIEGLYSGWDCDYWSRVASCTMEGQDGLRYYVSYDTKDHTITRVSKWISDWDVTIGELILAWGQPIGNDLAVVSWGNRTAFALGDNGLSPTDKVYFVSYYLNPTKEAPWTGFINRQPYSPHRLELPSLNLAPLTHP